MLWKCELQENKNAKKGASNGQDDNQDPQVPGAYETVESQVAVVPSDFER